MAEVKPVHHRANNSSALVVLTAARPAANLSPRTETGSEAPGRAVRQQLPRCAGSGCSFFSVIG